MQREWIMDVFTGILDFKSCIANVLHVVYKSMCPAAAAVSTMTLEHMSNFKRTKAF